MARSSLFLNQWLIAQTAEVIGQRVGRRIVVVRHPDAERDLIDQAGDGFARDPGDCGCLALDAHTRTLTPIRPFWGIHPPVLG